MCTQMLPRQWCACCSMRCMWAKVRTASRSKCPSPSTTASSKAIRFQRTPPTPAPASLKAMPASGASSILLAFDFDHTIVDGNTDTFITKAAPGGDIPKPIKDSYEPGQWTLYMGRVLAHLHSVGVGAQELQQVLQQLPLTAGMEQLMQHLQQRASAAGADCFSSIILSDSNSQFINWILSSRGYSSIFSNVYTNPAVVSEHGQLSLSPYHSHTCRVCPVNMCKRTILQEHRQLAQQKYDRVLYVGDGSNDLHPAQTLGPQDIVFVRAGYKLDQLLQDAKVAATVAAEVVRWNTAHDILQRLQQL